MKRRMSRLLSILLALCMVLALLPGTAFAANGHHPFTDVADTAWYNSAVQYVYEHGTMSGTSSTKFSPDTATSRGMIVTILHRLEGTPSATGMTFTDVAAGEYYKNAVAWASANNIVNGYSSSTFGPDDPITREQLAAILYRYAQYKGYDTTITGSVTAFSDGWQVSSYAVDAVSWAVGVGLLQGTGNNVLSPAGGATRAQAATILMRFCENVATQGGPKPDPDPTDGYTESYKDILRRYPEYTDNSWGKEYTEYILYDIDKNGIPELIIRSDVWKYAVYTFDGRNSVLCGEFLASYFGSYAELYEYDGNGIVIHSGGMGPMRVESVDTQQLVDNVLTEGISIGSTEDMSFDELYSMLGTYTLLNNFYRINDYTPFIE